MKQKQSDSTYNIVVTALYAVLIFLGISFFRIPLPSFIGAPFVHIGNALVAVGALLLGTKRGTIAAVIGLAAFDILNGYAAVAWVTVLESLIVILVIHLVYQVVLKGTPTPGHLIITGIAAAFTKVVIIFVKYTATQLMIGASLSVAITTAVSSMSATVDSAILTAILVPILYPILSRIMRHKEAQRHHY